MNNTIPKAHIARAASAHSRAEAFERHKKHIRDRARTALEDATTKGRTTVTISISAAQHETTAANQAAAAIAKELRELGYEAAVTCGHGVFRDTLRIDWSHNNTTPA